MPILYNPALLPPVETALACSLRRPPATRLLGLLRRLGGAGAPQHQLVLGAPGSGKTMLLRTLRTALLDDPELAARWLPLTFPEAQWDVARPADLWVNALDYLVVALERVLGDAPAARALEAALAALPEDEDHRAPAALALLAAESDRLGRRFVLLVDTLDVVLTRLKKDEWHVREVLSAEPRLLVIGTSARAIEATYRYDAAFYDFFQLHELRRLPRHELLAQVEALAPGPLRAGLMRAAACRPALEAALDLLGTQPRTLALLAEAATRVHDDAATAPLQGAPDISCRALVLPTLDALSPALQAKMDALAPQSQQLVHALATAWHPLRPHELAARARLAPNLVSAQLHRLVQDGLVDKVPLLPGARHGVRLADRLFQVWLLLRLGQPHRRRLVAACDALEATWAGHTPDLSELGLPDDDDPAIRLARTAPELAALVDGPPPMEMHARGKG